MRLHGGLLCSVPSQPGASEPQFEFTAPTCTHLVMAHITRGEPWTSKMTSRFALDWFQQCRCRGRRGSFVKFNSVYLFSTNKSCLRLYSKNNESIWAKFKSSYSRFNPVTKHSVHYEKGFLSKGTRRLCWIFPLVQCPMLSSTLVAVHRNDSSLKAPVEPV